MITEVIQSRDLIVSTADGEGLLGFLDSYRESEVLVNHGDDCPGFAADLRERGVEASAPELGSSHAC